MLKLVSDHMQKETDRRTWHATRDTPVSNSRELDRAHRTTSGRYPNALCRRTDAQRPGRPGRATERTTAQRTGALLLPLAPLAAPAEIKTMATLRLRDRRENDVILRGPAVIIAQAM